MSCYRNGGVWAGSWCDYSGGKAEENAVGQYTYSQQEMSCYRNGGVWAGSWCDYSGGKAEENAVGQYSYSQQEMSCYRNGCVWEETWCDCMLEAESRAVVNSGGSSSTFTTVTHIFAAVGLSAMLYGSFRYYTGKN